MEDKKLYTVAEVLEHIPVCRNTLLTHIKTGKIKATHIGRRIFIPENVFKQLLAGSQESKSVK